MLGPYPSFLDCFSLSFVLKAGAFGLPGGDQLVFAVPNQIGAPHGFKGVTQQGPVFSIVIAKESLMQASLFHLFGNVDVFTGSANSVKGVFAGVIHRRCVGHG